MKVVVSSHIAAVPCASRWWHNCG